MYRGEEVAGAGLNKSQSTYFFVVAEGPTLSQLK